MIFQIFTQHAMTYTTKRHTIAQQLQRIAYRRAKWKKIMPVSKIVAHV